MIGRLFIPLFLLLGFWLGGLVWFAGELPRAVADPDNGKRRHRGLDRR